MADAAVQPVISGAGGLEITCRETDVCSFYFVLNFKDQELPVPEELTGYMDMITGEKVPEGEMLSKYDVKIIRVEK